VVETFGIPSLILKALAQANPAKCESRVNNVLSGEIETAIIAVQSFRDEDLSEGDLPEQYKQPEFYGGMAGYFASTLDRCSK